ncbi:Kinesin heavy chain [Ascosphaera acerosa]|nr:Kinesin heavy chain [Ascosphaera acerosa]
MASAAPASGPGPSKDNTIKVVARFRPQNKIELASGGEPIVEFVGDDTCSVTPRDSSTPPQSFTFDRVFDTNSRQSDVFDFSIRPTVDDILNGYNGTVFAYGQTGAGKSYTMMGSDIDDAQGKGIIPRIVEQMFASILASPTNIEYTVRVSYMEIYMEKIRDLLEPANDNLPVHEEKSRGVYVKGLLEVYVSCIEEVYEVMRRGDAARKVAATNMNQESSRSHSIFVVTITQKNIETGSAKSGQLFLVDLAGSEKVGKTGASGQTLEEAKKINKSLSALGMVINALTDGRSTHIPYRDSKLTRILQESLGGNSRTTLIINCSPSSYNDAETISTLRFGVRAKAIKNKAKINAELSPAELKALLRKAQGTIVTFETYVGALESEVQQWRQGETVPKEKWTPARTESSGGAAAKIRDAAGAAAGAAPSPAAAAAAAASPSSAASGGSAGRSSRAKGETPPPSSQQQGAAATTATAPPSRPDSRIFDPDRAGTPSIIALDRDEREEFLRRENELQDAITEKESQIAKIEAELAARKEENKLLKEGSVRAAKESDRLGAEVNELRMQLEKVSYESKEAAITMDTLQDANAELTSELDALRQQLLDVRMSAKQTSAALDEKEKKKTERMAKMMAGFDLGIGVFSENERKIEQLVERVDALHAAADAGDQIPADDFVDLRVALVEAKGIVRQAELAVTDRDRDADESAAEQRRVLEQRAADLQQRYEELLEGKLSAEDVEAVKKQLGDAYVERAVADAKAVEELRAQIDRQKEELDKARAALADAQQHAATATATANANAAAAASAEGNANAAAAGTDAAAGVNGKTIQQQIADFEIMKKSLMRDLQNRCERVVELEISLDETREQYKNVVASSNNRAQQKKMAFLERNLEQLTFVQRQLVEQNGSLKREVAIAERKLAARNERIESLEGLLHDSQEKLTAANHRFETQLAAVKERLDAARLNRPGIGGGVGGYAPDSPFPGSRIAKPLRGGGAGPAAAQQQQHSFFGSLKKESVSLPSHPMPAQVTALQNEHSGNGGAGSPAAGGGAAAGAGAAGSGVTGTGGGAADGSKV